jgi:uncharacterized repeat protein (TIGR03803 family)
LVGWHHQSLLGHWSRHCYGIITLTDLKISEISKRKDKNISTGPGFLGARDPEGNLYGTTEDGEENSFFGELYELDPAGNVTMLHYFGGDTTDGGLPLGGVIRDSAGHLWGTTSQGGTDNAGTVYELTP